MSTELSPGAHVRALRTQRGWSQTKLARRAGISTSLLSKIEAGDRALTPTVAADIGRAMGLSKAEVLGRVPIAHADEAALTELREALRDYDIPQREPADGQEVGVLLAAAEEHRAKAQVTRLLPLLPALVRKTTAYAHRENSPLSWSVLTDVYSAVYWLAARHRWMGLAEIAVARQQWAAEQRPNPVAEAVAARDRAGTYLNFGAVETGLIVVDRALAAAQSALSGEERTYAVGILNLRGMTLAGRLKDKQEAAREADRHMRSAHAAAETFGRDRTLHGLTFGPGNTASHVLATTVDLGRPREAVAMAPDLPRILDGLPLIRFAATHINLARAQLDVGDRDGALASLSTAWEAAPESARIHAMGREVFRVLSSLHRRSNPQLLRLSKLSGVRL